MQILTSEYRLSTNIVFLIFVHPSCDLYTVTNHSSFFHRTDNNSPATYLYFFIPDVIFITLRNAHSRFIVTITIERLLVYTSSSLMRSSPRHQALILVSWSTLQPTDTLFIPVHYSRDLHPVTKCSSFFDRQEQNGMTTYF